MLPLLLIKMLLNVDIGDNFLHVLICLFLITIGYFAWRSTNIREQPHYHTVLLLQRHFRRQTARSRFTTHIESTSIVTGIQAEATGSASSGDRETLNNRQTTDTNKPPEPNTSSSVSEDTRTRSVEPDTAESIVEEQELEAIVEIMDADATEVRRRRLAYYENHQQGAALNRSGSSVEPLTSTTLTETVLQPSQNISDEPLMEHNYAEREGLNTVTPEPKHKDNADTPSSNNTNSIRIKLKYLNDELKLVDGRLEEQLGDFKRRHFQLEFSSNKLVRLIFNGQVLQPDSETLQSCGLFDNCVVHCLIHQQRNVANDGNASGANSNTNSGLPHSNNNNNNNNQGRDWDLGNILFALVSLILTSAWYFRYEYAHLYNVTATVALVAITGIFTIFLVGVYFPDYEQQRVPRQ